MKLNKKTKFKEVSGFSNCIEHTDLNAKDQLSKIISKYNKVVLELGCGRGEYTLGLVQLSQMWDISDTLFLGVDIQGERIWHGAKQAIEQNLENIIFLRTDISKINEYLNENTVDEIWITFPDPHLKNEYNTQDDSKKRARKRLTNQIFLDKYKKILKQNGKIHLKTDSKGLFEYTIEQIKNHSDFKIVKISNNVDKEIEELNEQVTQIHTKFENKWRKAGKEIMYLKAQVIK